MGSSGGKRGRESLDKLQSEKTGMMIRELQGRGGYAVTRWGLKTVCILTKLVRLDLFIVVGSFFRFPYNRGQRGRMINGLRTCLGGNLC